MTNTGKVGGRPPRGDSAKQRDSAQKKSSAIPKSLLDRLIKSHYERFSTHLKKMETKNRVKMLTKTRQEMARRFKLLYRSYRNKKFGEPIPQSLLKKKSNQ